MDTLAINITEYLYGFLDNESLGRMALVSKKYHKIFIEYLVNSQYKSHYEARMDKHIISLCERGMYDEFAKIFPKWKKHYPAKGGTAIEAASKNNHIKILKLLLTNKHISPSLGYNNSIVYASKNGYFEAVQLLLSARRCDPMFADGCAIRLARENNHWNIVGLLIQHGFKM